MLPSPRRMPCNLDASLSYRYDCVSLDNATCSTNSALDHALHRNKAFLVPAMTSSRMCAAGQMGQDMQQHWQQQQEEHSFYPSTFQSYGAEAEIRPWVQPELTPWQPPSTSSRWWHQEGLLKGQKPPCPVHGSRGAPQTAAPGKAAAAAAVPAVPPSNAK